MTRALDIVIYGATGFTGRQGARWLEQHAPAGVRLGIAGRDAQKLRELAQGLSRVDEVIVADSADAGAVKRMCERTRVVLSFAGPYARHGTTVVEGCVAARTHYVDISGETPWMRTMIDSHHARAAGDGTTIVPACGYDAVPADIGTLLAVEALRTRNEEATLRVDAFDAARGGLNGGTVASFFDMHDQGVAHLLADPFLLCPGDAPSADVRRENVRGLGVMREHDDGRWLGPALMGMINTQVVRRSAWLAAQAGRPYGLRFRYREHVRFRSRAKALTFAGELAAMNQLAKRRLVRRVARALLPRAGEGPSERTMDRGYFETEIVAVGERGGCARAVVSGAGDPGNRATIRFAAIAALHLLREERTPGGVLTPASALGAAYAAELRALGGFEVSCELIDPASSA